MNKIQNFVIWLDGYLDAVGDNINSTNTTMIKNKLNGLFEHEADKLGDKPSLQELGQIHNFPVYDGLPDYSNPPFNGLGRDEDGVLYRC